MGNRQRLRANGLFVEGLPPFGYAVQDRRLVIVPEHAAIVRRIYTDSRNGVSARQISEALLAEHPSVVVGRTKKHVMRWTVNNARSATKRDCVNSRTAGSRLASGSRPMRPRRLVPSQAA